MRGIQFLIHNILFDGGNVSRTCCVTCRIRRWLAVNLRCAGLRQQHRQSDVMLMARAAFGSFAELCLKLGARICLYQTVRINKRLWRNFTLVATPQAHYSTYSLIQSLLATQSNLINKFTVASRSVIIMWRWELNAMVVHQIEWVDWAGDYVKKTNGFIES